MPMLDRLYQPTTKDILSANSNVRRWYKSITATGVGNPLTVVDTELGPPDIVRHITQVVFNWDAGAAQNGISAFLGIISGGQVVMAVAGMPAFNIADINCYTTIPSDLLWMQGETLQGQAYFSAVGVNNTINISMSGWEFPRGSIQR